MTPDSHDMKTTATPSLVLTKELAAHRDGVKAIVVSPDGEWKASADVGRRVIIWDGDEPELVFDPFPIWERMYANRMVYALASSPDSYSLYLAATDRLTAYHAASGHRMWGYRGPRVLAFLPSSPVGIAVNPTSHWIAAAFDDGHVGIWSPDGVLHQKWFDNDAPRQLAYTRDGEKLIGTDSFSICMWDAHSHAKIAKHVPNERVHALALSKAADVAASRTLYDITIWDVETGAESAKLPIGRGLPLICFSPTDPMLAYTEKETLRLCDLNGAAIGSVEVPAESVTSLAFSHNGQEILAGCSDDLIRVFETPGRKQFRID